MGFPAVAVQHAAQVQEFLERPGPVQINNHVVTMPASKRAVPQVNHPQRDQSAADDRARKLLGTRGHPDDDDSQDIGGVQSVAENVAEADHREHRHHAERGDEVVR